MFVEARFAVDDTSFLCNDGTAADFETRLTVSVIHQVKTDKPLRFLLFLYFILCYFLIIFLLKSGAEKRF